VTSTHWHQLSVLSIEPTPELCEEALLAVGAIAVTLTDDGDHPLLEPPPGTTPLWPHTRVTGLFAADTDMKDVERQLRQQLGINTPRVLERQALEERDWVRAWLDDFKPMQFGQRLWVCPSTLPPPDPQAVNLRLDPGLAFGTGTHPTTALCLTWLDSAPVAQQRVLDYGCGSGILAIAAALLGAEQVQVVDIDPQALLACAQNAAHNQVAERITAVDPDTLALGSVDTLLANILAAPLVTLAPRLSSLLTPGGWLVLSGILQSQAAAVQAAYAADITFESVQEQDGWVLLVGRKTMP
jgi:ribosomal protein L11 methyltransferase